MGDEIAESGHQFEVRGLELARARHDPYKQQGSLNIYGAERDGVFVTESEINIYEFTISQKKDKAEKDGRKICSLMNELMKKKAYEFHSITGWFVTQQEPTADQRTSIKRIAQKGNVRIFAISFLGLMARVCDSQDYLLKRDEGVFGSAGRLSTRVSGSVSVETRFLDEDGRAVSVQDLETATKSGERFLINGEFGSGKSHALWELYLRLKKSHLESAGNSPFPLYVNLRSCIGTRSPAEILNRHAQDIGFSNRDGLTAAWRSGACVLLLDGFDEIVPTRRLGGLADLKEFRWSALSAIRTLIDETPSQNGIVITGRRHYFSDEDEMLRDLNLMAASVLSIEDFDEAQVSEFLRQSGSELTLPDWLPRRPLLLRYFTKQTLNSDQDSRAVGRGAGWVSFLSQICEREARMFQGITPKTIERILARVATLARATSTVVGPLTTLQMRDAYVKIAGRDPDDEANQLLLRLPGLDLSEGFEESGEDERVFVDRELAEAAYGVELAQFVVDLGSGESPLQSSTPWDFGADDLAIEVAAEEVCNANVETGAVFGLAKRRQSRGLSDAILMDLLRLSAELGEDVTKPDQGFAVSGVQFESLRSVECAQYSQVQFVDCVIDVLDISDIESSSGLSMFRNCMIGHVAGISSLSAEFGARFSNCEIGGLDSPLRTTDGIMGLSIDVSTRIALTILKKIYLQAGSARKEGSLYRGHASHLRGTIDEVIRELETHGWINKVRRRGVNYYSGVRGRRRDVLRGLDAPAAFRI